MSRKPLLVLLMWGLMSASAWASSEQMVNGGFETGSLAPWAVANGPCTGNPCTPWTVVTGGANGSSYSAQDQGGYIISQTFATSIYTGLMTEASFWFKTDPGVLFGVELFYQDGSNHVVLESALDSNWDRYDLLNELQNGSGSGEFLTEIVFGTGSTFPPNTNSTSWLDDVSIMANSSYPPPTTPEPDALLLIGAGLVGLGLIPSLQPARRQRR